MVETLFIHPDDAEFVLNAFNQIKEKKQIMLQPFRFMDRDGDWKWVETKVTNLIDDPEIKGLVVNSKEMTELVSKRMEVEHLYKRYRLVSKATKDIIYDWDILKNKVLRSPSFVKHFGMKRSDSIGRSNDWLDRIVENERRQVLEKLQKSLENSRVKKWRIEYSILNSKNQKIHVTDHAFIIRDANGKPIRIVGTIRDITKSKELIKKIKEQNVSLKELAWEQAHLLRAPVTRILALIDNLENKTYLEWSRKELLEIIKNSALELDSIILKRVEKLRK